VERVEKRGRRVLNIGNCFWAFNLIIPQAKASLPKEQKAKRSR